jgi:hypothetical protein
LQRADSTPVTKKERSPISHFSRTPKAQLEGDGDINDNMALELEEEELEGPPANIDVALAKNKVKSRADTGSSLATLSPFKRGTI